MRLDFIDTLSQIKELSSQVCLKLSLRMYVKFHLVFFHISGGNHISPHLVYECGKPHIIDL